jgi:hypothetical protein
MTRDEIRKQISGALTSLAPEIDPASRTSEAVSRRLLAAQVLVPFLLALIGVAPTMSQFRPRHLMTAGTLVLSVVIFGVLLADSMNYADRLLLRIQIIEASQPPLR